MEKAGKYLFGCIYIGYASFFGYSVLKDQEYMPKMLGGTGDYINCFNGSPYVKHAPKLKEYYLLVTGYHLSQLIVHGLGT